MTYSPLPSLLCQPVHRLVMNYVKKFGVPLSFKHLRNSFVNQNVHRSCLCRWPHHTRSWNSCICLVQSHSFYNKSVYPVSESLASFQYLEVYQHWYALTGVALVLIVYLLKDRNYQKWLLLISEVWKIPVFFLFWASLWQVNLWKHWWPKMVL